MKAETSVPEQREAGLDRSESWLSEAVLRDSPAGMAYLSPDLRFAWVNPALARMYGRDPAEFPGQQGSAMWPAVDAARAEAVLQQVIGQDRPATETFPSGAGAPEDRG